MLSLLTCKNKLLAANFLCFLQAACILPARRLHCFQSSVIVSGQVNILPAPALYLTHKHGGGINLLIQHSETK